MDEALPLLREDTVTDDDPQEPPDYCWRCGVAAEHEDHECDPADVRDHVREMRWEYRMREAGL